MLLSRFEPFCLVAEPRQGVGNINTSQEARNLFEWPLSCGKTNALESMTDKCFEAFKGERKVGSTLHGGRGHGSRR